MSAGRPATGSPAHQMITEELAARAKYHAEAREALHAAIDWASKSRLTNDQIGKAIGMTEAGVRRIINKRRNPSV